MESSSKFPHPRKGRSHLSTDDDAVAARAALNVVLLILGGAGVLVAAAGATAVETDALALAGDAVALADAAGAVGSGSGVTGEGRAGAGAVGAVADGRAGGGDGGGAHVEVGDDVLIVLVVDASGGKAAGELVDVVVGIEDVAGGVGRHGLGSLDLGHGERATLGDVDGEGLALGGLDGVAGVAGGALGGGRRLGNVEDVQGAAGGGLNSGLLGGVVGDVVTIDDVVVPVALTGLDKSGLEAEGALPRAGLGRGLVLREGELAGVVVPGTKKMDGLDAGRNTERERKLNGGHVD